MVLELNKIYVVTTMTLQQKQKNQRLMKASHSLMDMFAWLFATVAFAVGLDPPNIRQVICQRTWETAHAGHFLLQYSIL